MRRLKLSLLLAVLGASAVCQFTAAQSAEPGQALDPVTDAKLAQVKNAVGDLQVAIERYGIDHPANGVIHGESRYPHSLSQLVRPQGINNVGYAKPGFYHNPLAPGADGELNAMQVPFGWSAAAIGNFSYLTQYNDAGEVVAYVLVVYGPATGEGSFSISADDQPDGIIATMTSSNVNHQTPQVCYDNGRLVELDWRLAE